MQFCSNESQTWDQSTGAPPCERPLRARAASAGDVHLLSRHKRSRDPSILPRTAQTSSSSLDISHAAGVRHLFLTPCRSKAEVARCVAHTLVTGQI